MLSWTSCACAGLSCIVFGQFRQGVVVDYDIGHWIFSKTFHESNIFWGTNQVQFFFLLPVIRIKLVRYQKYEIKTTLPMYASSCAGELMISFFEEVDTNVANTVLLHRVASRKETLAFFLFCAWFSNGLALQFLIATPSVYLRRMRYHFAGTCSLI